MFKTYETQEAREASLKDARVYDRDTSMSTIVRKVIDGRVAYVREPAGTLGDIWDKAKANGVEGVCLGTTDYKETNLAEDPFSVRSIGTVALVTESASELVPFEEPEHQQRPVAA